MNMQSVEAEWIEKVRDTASGIEFTQGDIALRGADQTDRLNLRRGFRPFFSRWIF
jgi:hypothetical protein